MRARDEHAHGERRRNAHAGRRDEARAHRRVVLDPRDDARPPRAVGGLQARDSVDEHEPSREVRPEFEAALARRRQRREQGRREAAPGRFRLGRRLRLGRARRLGLHRQRNRLLEDRLLLVRLGRDRSRDGGLAALERLRDQTMRDASRRERASGIGFTRAEGGGRRIGRDHGGDRGLAAVERLRDYIDGNALSRERAHDFGVARDELSASKPTGASNTICHCAKIRSLCLQALLGTDAAAAPGRRAPPLACAAP